MIFVIDDDEILAECVGRATKREYKVFLDAMTAMSEIGKGELPEMIFLDVLLDGPDGFTFLHELVSYEDTAKIPVVLVTSFKVPLQGLSDYGVVAVLNKDTMLPEDIFEEVEKFEKGLCNAEK